MGRGRVNHHLEEEDFIEEKKHSLRRAKAAKELCQKRKSSKIRQGIERYYTVRQNKGPDLSEDDFDDFDDFDDYVYH